MRKIAAFSAVIALFKFAGGRVHVIGSERSSGEDQRRGAFIQLSDVRRKVAVRPALRRSRSQHSHQGDKDGRWCVRLDAVGAPRAYQLFLDAEIPDKENPAYHSSLCETQQWFTALPDELRRAFPPSLATE